MTTVGWQEVIGVIGVFVLLTTVITVSIWQFAATRRAKAVLAQETEWRLIAQRSLQSQEEIGKDLAAIRTRLDGLERILKDVE
jgi:hypothetical protein